MRNTKIAQFGGLWIVGLVVLAMGIFHQPAQLASEDEDVQRFECLAARGDVSLLRQVWGRHPQEGWFHMTSLQHLNGSLRIAASAGQAAVVAQLLEWGADAGSSGPSHRTALMDAAGSDHSAEIAARLLSSGADPEAKDMNGRTALDEALDRHDVALSDFLMSNLPNAVGDKNSSR